jgi:hypothetical protein
MRSAVRVRSSALIFSPDLQVKHWKDRSPGIAPELLYDNVAAADLAQGFVYPLSRVAAH